MNSDEQYLDSLLKSVTGNNGEIENNDNLRNDDSKVVSGLDSLLALEEEKNENKIDIEDNSGQMSQDEIEKLLKEANLVDETEDEQKEDNQDITNLLNMEPEESEVEPEKSEVEPKEDDQDIMDLLGMETEERTEEPEEENQDIQDLLDMAQGENTDISGETEQDESSNRNYDDLSLDDLLSDLGENIESSEEKTNDESEENENSEINLEDIPDLDILSSLQSDVVGDNLDISENEDQDLAEINSLLQKSDNHEIVDDDDMLALLENASKGETEYDKNTPDNAGDNFDIFAEEESGEETDKKKKRRKRKERKERKQDVEESNEGNDGSESEKKSGFKNFLTTMFGEDDEDLEEEVNEDKVKKKNKRKKKPSKIEEEGQLAEISEENTNIMKEMDRQEDEESGADKKGRKKKEKKPKKEKKEKKPKKQKEETEDKGKPLPKKKVRVVVLLSITIAAGILLVCNLLPGTMDKLRARKAFYNQDYKDTYMLLYGQKLGESDQIIYKKSLIILQMQRRIDVYNNYTDLGKNLEALDSLMMGALRYDQLLQSATELGVQGELQDIYQQILTILQDKYQLTEDQVREINAYESDYVYSLRLESIVNGTEFVNPYDVKNSNSQENQEQEQLQDVLPEEEDIIQNSNQAEPVGDDLINKEQ